MGTPIKNIVIVGGGTAGWLTAAYLNHRLQWAYGHPEGVRVTLIEAPDVPTIGVGEATVPTMVRTLRHLEISEREFIARTEATFKLGVDFRNWNVDESGAFTRFFHGFEGGVQIRGRNPGAALLAYGADAAVLGCDPSFTSVIGHSEERATLYKGPKMFDSAPFTGPQGYAYHLDAGKFAALLAEIAVGRGVEHVRDTVVGATRDERGNIAELVMADGTRRPVELVIDCTGFQGLLINKAMDEPFLSYADYLFNDRAIPVQIAHASTPDLYPATISTARRSGWSWKIPLQSRIGTGYVFSSAFASDEQALDEVRGYLDGETLLTEPRTLNMRVGHCRRSWVGNCVAIGLSGGFIEPLESTAIQLIETACRRLLQFFPSVDFEPALAEKFNEAMTGQYEEIRDFLGLHFSLSNRDDTPYWRAVRHEAKRSDRLNESLAVWRHSLPDALDHRASNVFSYWSLCTLLFGKGFYTAPPGGGTDMLPREVWERFQREWGAIKKTSVDMLPDHSDLLRHIVAGAKPGSSAARAPHVPPVTIGGDALSDNLTVMRPPVAPVAR
ncbi:tryptophan halogenase family protein [Sphingomonas sp. MMS24-J45]|uniref:tryptophan halogenase family protein n=1 Tax=Sphingomonas sp. MMS24-J45 TaxID=3238806 RepID=UPI00384CAA73